MKVIENGNYIYEDGWYKTIFRIYIPYGRGINLRTEEVMAIRKVTQVDGCVIRFTYKSKNINHKTMVAYSKKSDKKANAGSNLDEQGDTSEYRKRIKYGYIKHWSEYGNVKTEPNTTGIQHVMFFLCKAKSLELLTEQIELVKSVYKKGDYREFTQYIELIPMLGKEYKTIKEVLTSDFYLLDKDTDTNLQLHYSGIDNFESGVLQDENGTLVGNDVYSGITKAGGIAKQSKILFDYNSYTMKQALVAIPENMANEHYLYKHKNRNNIVPTASVIGQSIANHIILNSHVPPMDVLEKQENPHKVAHIVLNDFSYRNVRNTNLFLDRARLFNTIDMNDVTINPLQPTGDVTEQDRLYSSIQKKISTIFNLGNDYNLGKDEIVAIETAVIDVFSNKWWGEDFHDKKILGQNPKIFPDMANVAEMILQKQDEYIAKGLDGNKLETLVNILKKIINSRRTLIGRKTNFEAPFSYQTYYDYSNIGDESLKLIQLVNSINTIITTLNDGDCLIIHGADRIPPEVFSDYLNLELKRRCLDKGIRVVYCMDTFITGLNYKIQEYKGVLYQNYDKDFDYLIQGFVPAEKFDELVTLYGQPINDRLKIDLTYDSVKGRAFIRRASTLKSALCDIERGII